MKKVLIVDDSRTTLAMMTGVFKMAGYDIATCDRGSDVLRTAQALKPDLILLDMMLPDTKGLDVFKQLKGDAQARQIPVVFLTGREDAQEVGEAMSLGAKGYLTKYNTTPKSILEKVKAWLPPD